MTCGGAVNTSDAKNRASQSRLLNRKLRLENHQHTPTAAAPLNIRQMPIATGANRCDTRSSRMNDVPQINVQKIKARYGTAAGQGVGGGWSELGREDRRRLALVATPIPSTIVQDQLA